MMNHTRTIVKSLDKLIPSPKSVLAALPSPPPPPPPLFLSGRFADTRLSLPELVTALPDTVRARQATRTDVLKDDPIMELFQRLDLESCDWKRFAHLDTTRNYTRNLIATDDATFTLLLLCWNPGKHSPIHDHPCDGCWMRVLSGTVREKRYIITTTTTTNNNCQQQQQQRPHNGNPDETNHLASTATAPAAFLCYQDKTYQQEDGIVFIHDSMGYHSVGNPSVGVPAVTLHLYCPPFQRCRIWLDEQSGNPTTSTICYHSEYGRITATS